METCRPIRLRPSLVDRFVQMDHPGVVDLQAKYPGIFPDATHPRHCQSRGRRGLRGWTGTGSQAGNGHLRLAAGIEGTAFNDEHNIAVSWSKRERYTTGVDMYVERMALAFDGFGGFDCDPATGTPGQGGCLYFTPFSNGWATSALTGFQNPDANPELVRMNRELQTYLDTGELGTQTDYELMVFDATSTEPPALNCWRNRWLGCRSRRVKRSSP